MTKETLKKKKASTKKPSAKKSSPAPQPVVVEDYILEEELPDLSEVYDEGDIASAIEMGFTRQALINQRNKNKPETHPDFDGKHCVDCHEEIHEVRLAMGKVRCVDCQEFLEKKNRHLSKTT